ncbi:zinc-dependent metalloprotease family protein [Crenothrix polyspora]|nr:zinc-dependent metalloprotease family protein [Crenothrix polyspora]
MRKYRVTSQLLIFAISAMPLAALSRPANVKHFGRNSPFKIADLPASRVKSSLQALPAATQEKALTRLHRFSFTAADLPYLNIDSKGAAFYSDTFLPEPTAKNTAAASGFVHAPQPISAADAFALHSKPGATKVVYLDFNGHVISGTAWNDATHPSYKAKPYDTDNALDTFSSTELSAIHEIWHRIAEDYAAFNVDVTTQEPVNFGPTVGRVLITHSTDRDGQIMPSSTGGGIAYVGVWGDSDYASTHSPAMVFYNHLGPGYSPFIAEAASHEMGHNLGLNHDGTSVLGYYKGHGDGLVSWGAIMGNSYSQNVTQWSKGEYADANNQQDDLSIISNLLTYRTDDHSNLSTGATALLIDTAGAITATNPENDPFNTATSNKGIIETRDDIDYFKFNAGDGALQININPTWIAFLRSDNRGSNLDIQATLYDQNGTQVTQVDPIDNTNAVINATVTAGTYFLAVAGVGNSVSPYSDYASLGEYFISGTITPGVPADTTAPTPNPMTWSISPNAGGSSNSINMTATVATDNSGGAVQYQFICVSGGQGCVTSAWQASNQYTATNLAGATPYSYQVKAKDAANNETSASLSVSASTMPVDNTPPTPNPMKWQLKPNAGQSSTSITMTAVLAKDTPSSAIAYKFVCVSGGKNCVDSSWQSTNQYNATDLSPATKYTFKVKAKDASGNETALSAAGLATTKQAAPLAPTNLTGSRLTATKTNLTWGAISNATRYEIWRCTVAGSVCNYSRTATANVNAYNGVAPTSTVRYKVRATNTAGSSAFSNELNL